MHLNYDLQRLIDTGTIARAQGLYLAVFIDPLTPKTHEEATAIIAIRFGKIMPARNSRISELVRLGLLEPIDPVKNPRTGAMVTRYQWTGRLVVPEPHFEYQRCHHCAGRGGRLVRVYWPEDGQQRLFPDTAGATENA